MEDLSKKKCVPCDGGIPSFNLGEIHKYLKKVDGWDVKKDENENFYLIKEFKFENFFNSQSFASMKLQKMKGIILIFGLDGDMQKSRSSLMQLMDLLRVTLFLQPK